MPQILSVSYDASLLNTRKMMLERSGYEVVSACGFGDALYEFNAREDFALFILGHSIPQQDKETLIAAFRARCAAPILALRRLDEEIVCGADFVIDPDPGKLLALVSKIVSSDRAAGLASAE